MFMPGAEAEVFTGTVVGKTGFVVAAMITGRESSVDVFGCPPELLGIGEEFCFETGDQLTAEIPVGAFQRVLDQACFEQLRGFSALVGSVEPFDGLFGKRLIIVDALEPDLERIFWRDAFGPDFGLADNVIEDTGELLAQVPGG